MRNNTLALVLKNDWVTSPLDHTYNGKYTLGQFHLTDTFIVEYMKLIHGIEIPDSWISSCFTNISDTNTRKVMYMEGCGMLSKDTMNEIRNAVKFPTDDVKIYRNGKKIVKIKFMEDHNETTN
ncbi:hypothetical protein ACP26C_07805 [Franconibacter helveticus 513]|uniref:hypothetical protein n=1 Tax=Franconibacter helveticus TaxID=357240 RepID=UPI0004659380|nr:hypothetical protein [Franconibacter helveticus]